MTKQSLEKKLWKGTSKLLKDFQVKLSSHWSYNFIQDPKRLGFVLSRYKFAAKMSVKNAKILELGCSEGIGAPILSENALSYYGVDLDKDAIESAKKNINSVKCTFIHDDFLNKSYDKFDTIVSLDVIEHIYKENENLYFDTIVKNLSENGLCIIGTPNISANQYASKASKLGHVNLYSQERLVTLMKQYFHQVLPFGLNDEIMHTGFSEMSHYLINVGCHKK